PRSITECTCEVAALTIGAGLTGRCSIRSLTAVCTVAIGFWIIGAVLNLLIRALRLTEAAREWRVTSKCWMRGSAGFLGDAAAVAGALAGLGFGVAAGRLTALRISVWLRAGC